MGDFEALKTYLDIQKVAREYTSLKEVAPGSFLGLCPLHDEKTPSFRVDANKGLYFCFACKSGGDVLSLIHHKEGIPYSEIVNFSKAKYNLPIEERQKDQEKTNQLSVLKLLISLVSDSERKRGEDYLVSRISYLKDPSSYGVFFFSEDLSNKLLDRLGNDRSLRDAAVALSLVYRRPNGSLYCPFVNRVVFPLSKYNSIVGLNGRVTSGGSSKKYLLTSKAKIWSKRQYVYGMEWAREVARNKGVSYVYVTEGVLDAISLLGAGIPAVCVLGSTISVEQFIEIYKSFETLYLSLDTDNAGTAGVNMSLYSAFKEGVVLSGFLVKFPKGLDANDFLSNIEGDAERVLELEKRSFEDVIIDQYITLSRKSLINRDDVAHLKKKVLNKISEHLYDYKTNQFSKTLIIRLSERMGYKPDFIFTVMENGLKKAKETSTKIFNATDVSTFSQVVDIADIKLLRLIHTYPELYNTIRTKDWFALLSIHTKELLEIIVQRDSDPKVNTVELIDRKTKVNKELKSEYQQVLITVTKYHSDYDWRPALDKLDRLYTAKMNTGKRSLLVYMSNRKKQNLRTQSIKSSKEVKISPEEEVRVF